MPRDVSVKIVVTPECSEEEVEGAISLIARANPGAVVFLQPEFDEAAPVVGGERMLRLMNAGLKKLPDVRVSLQIHKILRVK